jgi:Arc/MetJ-type ribon-helix-helix transcriptional regulator
MGAAKLAITMEKDLPKQVDRWVAEGRYPNRSQAIQAAVQEKLERTRRRRLAEEAAKLDPREERALAEEGFAAGAKT